MKYCGEAMSIHMPICTNMSQTYTPIYFVAEKGTVEISAKWLLWQIGIGAKPSPTAGVDR